MRTTHVGSLVRPDDLVAFLRQRDAGEAYDEQAYQDCLARSVREVVAKQREAGIDIVSDGEWRRETYVDVVGEIMAGYRWVKRDEFSSHQVIVERMTPLRPGVIAAASAADNAVPLGQL